jgi:hypothetical protein
VLAIASPVPGKQSVLQSDLTAGADQLPGQSHDKSIGFSMLWNATTFQNGLIRLLGEQESLISCDL